MEIIYQNFDCLEVSFQGAVPRFILKQLQEAKAEAHALKMPVFAKIGWGYDFPVMVHETGARGGYTYQFNTGHDGFIWLIGDRESAEQWNIRVKVRSLCLALYGYKETKQRIYEILFDVLKARGSQENNRIPKERISRVDYCLDFILEEQFFPSPENFVCHGRTNKSENGVIPYNCNSKGNAAETLTIGKMPNKQVSVYNKIREITAKHKSYWWDIWGINKNECKKEIWRIEVRAGKKELNKWNLRTFNDFEKIIGNIIRKTLETYEYTNPNEKDTNRNRWETAVIWKKAINATKNDLFSYSTEVDEKLILNRIKNEVTSRYEKLISGIFVGYTAATGKDISEIPGVLDYLCGHVMDEIAKSPQKFIQKHKRKSEEFSFLE